MRGEVNAIQLSKNPIMERATENNIPIKKDFQTQDEDFKKLLAKKKEEKHAQNKRKADSKTSKDTKDDETINDKKKDKVESKASKDTKDNETINNKEKNKVENKEIIQENVKNDEVQENLNKLEILVENIMQVLQSNTSINEDKLEALTKELEETLSQMDINNQELNASLNLNKLDNLIKNLQLINSSGIIVDESFKAMLQESAEKLSQAMKSTDKQLDTLNEKSYNAETTNEGLNVDDGKKINSNNQDMANNLSSQNENKENSEHEKGKPKEPESKGSEIKMSTEGSTKKESEVTFKNNINLDLDLISDKDMAAIKNVQIENNNTQPSQVNKTLNSSTIKQDLNIFNQVLEGTKVSISDDVSEMVLKLKPDNLGKLSMKIVVERGLVVAKFDVESQIVKEAIESNLEDLRNALSDKGFEVKEFDVSVNKDSQEQESSFSYFNKRKSKKALASNNPVKNETVINNSYNISGLDSSINYLA